jgi:sugar lactone lactonase YvrE
MFFIQDACLTGFKMILDMAFDDEGNLYVLQHATGAIQQTGPGVLIRVTPNQGQSSICAQYQTGTRTTVLGGLSRPTSVAIGPDGAIYVTNKGIEMATRDESGKLLTGGEVLRFEPPGK